MIPTPPIPGKQKLPPALTAVYGAIALMIIGATLMAAKGGGRPPKVALKPNVAPKSATVKSAAPRPLLGVTVVLDPGHGGIDSGSICAGTREDALNYRLTATIAAALKNAGAKIVYTVRSASLEVPIVEGAKEPPLMIPRDALLCFDGTTILGNKKSLAARAAVTRPYWAALTDDQRRTGRGLYFLAVHHDDNAEVRGGRIEYDMRGGEPPLLAAILTQRMAGQSFDKKLAAWGRRHADPRRLYVLKPENNPVIQRALLEAATISSPIDRDLAYSRQFRWQIAKMVRDSIIECEKTLKNAPITPLMTASITPSALTPGGVSPARNLIAARKGGRKETLKKPIQSAQRPITQSPNHPALNTQHSTLASQSK